MGGQSKTKNEQVGQHKTTTKVGVFGQYLEKRILF